MKLAFSRSVPYTPEWNGNKSLPEEDQIKCTLTPMKVGHLLDLMDAIGIQGSDKVMVSAQQMSKVIGQLGHLVPEYIHIKGLEDTDGPVTPDLLVQQAFYLELTTELVMKLAEISMPSENATKNLKTPLA